MHRLQLPLLLGLVLAVSAPPLAKGQDGRQELDRYKTQEPDTKNDKSKDKKQARNRNNNDDGHRKHWWSLPHFRHKKHDSDSNARQTTTKSSGKTAAVKPVSSTGAPKTPGNKTAAVTRPSQKPQARTGQGARAAAGTNASKKNVAGKGQSAKSASGTKANRKTAGTNQAKKTVRHNCSPEETKKGGCQAEKRPAAKGTTSPS